MRTTKTRVSLNTQNLSDMFGIPLPSVRRLISEKKLFRNKNRTFQDLQYLARLSVERTRRQFNHVDV